MLLTECITEFIGSVIICIIGVWTRNAFLAGSTIMVCSLVAFNANLSKGSFNPTITLAMTLFKQQSWSDMFWYLLAQFSGAGIVWFTYTRYY
jgi:glycerol uptake facilitator-like aquaporin